jgi:hypothetical protein
MEALFVERDEDMEIALPESRIYVQVKTRSREIVPSDMPEILARFEDIRRVHVEGLRPLVAEFWIVTNTEPSPSLKDQVNKWPKDLHYRSPDFHVGDTNAFPPAWKVVEEAIEWCVRQAERVPFASLDAETLVWKLAGLVLYACVGSGRKEFIVAELPALFEQLVVQLHRFPALPSTYRPHEDEPNFSTEAPIRLVVGFSGAGKTTWAAHGSLHSVESVAYFDIGDMPTSAVAPSLARELAAILFPGKRDEIRKLMLPGASGLQSLRAIDLYIQRNGLILTTVLDNVHRMDANELIAIVRVAPSIRWTFLAQPWQGRTIIEAAMRIDVENLQGWSFREIAHEFSTFDCSLNPIQAERVRRVTGGLPLFVQSSAKMVRDYYAGDPDKFCDEVETLTHSKTTGQEAILSQVQQRLPAITSQVASLLAISDVPLSARDTKWVIGNVLKLSEPEVSAAMRQLESWGILETLRDGRVSMHDSFRPLAQHVQGTLGNDVLVKAKELLVIVLRKGFGIPTFRLICKLLPEIGQMETLVDIASDASEYFHEFGMSQEFESTILEAINTDSLAPSDRFWAIDTIVFWKLQTNRISEARRYFQQLEGMSSTFEFGDRKIQAVALKRLLLAGHSDDLRALKKAFEEASALSPEDELFHRILRYNYASCLYLAGHYDSAESLTFPLIQEYFEVLGLTPEDVTFKNLDEIFPKLKKTAFEGDDLKHLADSLDLHARVMDCLGRRVSLARLHAFKFYVMANALTSALKVGRDIVDQFLGMGDAPGARHFLESMLLRVFSEGQGLDHFLPVNSQYAVVLAYCGEIAAARRTMRELKPYLQASPEWQDEYENQQRLIELIAAGVVSLLQPPAPQPMLVEPRRTKIGRNEPCPCGSGKKYKKCHGK